MQSFVFSVVMAVYNSEKYVKEAFESLRRQSIGFERIQVILVDDGSTDRSGRICDGLAGRYPRNVAVIHQKNAGQSCARNRGIEIAAGKYINFMDSDDRMTPNVLEQVAAFFAEHEPETDVVSVPVRYFEADEGEHWQNGLFAQGNRVIDLRDEYTFLQASSSYAFFVRERVREVRFPEGISYAEDTRYAMTCLAEKQTIGLVGNCYYEYRRRIGESSTTQKLAMNPLWKTRWMEQYEFWAIDYFLRREGAVPKWVQYALLCHVGNRVNVDRRVGPAGEDREYTERIRRVVSVIDPEVFRVTREVERGNALLLRSLIRPEESPRLQMEHGEWNLMLGEETTGTVQTWPVRIDRLIVQQNRAEVTGIFYLFAGMKEQEIQLEWQTAQEKKRIALERDESKDITWNGNPVYQAYGFFCGIPIGQNGITEASFRVRMGENGGDLPGEIVLGDRIPILPIPHSTGWSSGWKYIVSASGIHLIPCGTFAARAKREAGWYVTLLKKKHAKAAFARMGYTVMKCFGATPKWAAKAQDRTMDQLDYEMRFNADLLF